MRVSIADFSLIPHTGDNLICNPLLSLAHSEHFTAFQSQSSGEKKLDSKECSLVGYIDFLHFFFPVVTNTKNVLIHAVCVCNSKRRSVCVTPNAMITIHCHCSDACFLRVFLLVSVCVCVLMGVRVAFQQQAFQSFVDMLFDKAY